jgi:autotransporter-associated beta strand protein
VTNGSRSLRKTGETLTVGGVITDQTGSRGGSLGAGGLIVRGTGTVALAADNGVTGGTTIDAGATLDLAVNGAAGQGGVTFDTGSVLQIGAGVAVGNTVFGFAAGDLFDFRGIGPASNTTATIDNANTLVVSNSTVTQD